ncbi:hypothetical protein H8S20_04575 [Clostridium sp. NSJ-6]|uniref:Uncharacterized protein n=1 Tax=Clostridium hominis TaxID=2763036 RepID=A0ABR7D9U2_9CLOT|nr:hypothetical protein [Clostridium hominis]MBC5628165.1 hypothetical protein [Clostridium hominis]MDU2674310.1 hypothetical protein [Clostridium sp.]
MKKRFFILLSSLIIVLNFIILTAHANVPIQPVDAVYKQGIYQINSSDINSYNLQYQFLNPDKNSAIIVLDQNADIVYKNINCNRKCNAGTITNKNTIVLITDGEVALYFTKE